MPFVNLCDIDERSLVRLKTKEQSGELKFIEAEKKRWNSCDEALGQNLSYHDAHYSHYSLVHILAVSKFPINHYGVPASDGRMVCD